MDQELLEHLKEKGQGTLELIHTMENFLLIIGFDGKVLLTSDSLYDKTNIVKETFTNSQYYDYFFKNDATPLNLFDLLLLTEKEKSLELNINTVEGEPPIETLVISSCILKNFFQEEDYILLLLADMREQKRNQMQLMHTNKLVSLGEMATSIAHEINNPITIITGQLNMLEKSIRKIDGDTQKSLQITEKIKKNFDRITKIIKSLRSISRKDEHVPIEKIKLFDIFDSLKDLSEQKLSMSNTVFSLEGLNEKQELMGRETQLLQVLLNLVNNSLDSVQEEQIKWVKVIVAESEDQYLISILDSGKGIPFEVQVRLFEPFYTTKDIGKGTGLGLSISKGLIESHGGSLTYDSKSPNTCFKIVLPKKLDTEKVENEEV
ncbi:hypothetical protein A9Q84_06970 [Halobacteriovorax marinus]|uniref:histidine kinase n=1 Tax=Halobacteriovorax marinus TaxID=97084 RepID=A0A1Y5F9X1_9BACT|nr:hypothetical protein A9Q84_06970 [Halobacteriovorax marinus]